MREQEETDYLTWKLELETVQLQCFMFDKNAGYLAEAIAAHPAERKGAPSNAPLNRDVPKRAP
jgi:hypothetical protein